MDNLEKIDVISLFITKLFDWGKVNPALLTIIIIVAILAAAAGLYWWYSRDGKKADDSISKVGSKEGSKKSGMKTKENTKILFIDDKEVPVVSTLSNLGYKIQIRKDLESIEDTNGFDIFFVDIQGVGIKMCFSDQGFGLVKAIRDERPNSKIVIYSAERLESNPAYKQADDVLKKDSEWHEFQSVIDGLITELNKQGNNS